MYIKPPPYSQNPNPQSPSTPPASTADDFLGYFKDTPYGNSTALKNVVNDFYNVYRDRGVNWHTDPKSAQHVFDQLSSYANTFQSMFKNSVGRDPNSDEYNQFFDSVISPAQTYDYGFNSDELRQKTSGLLSQYYTRTAQDEAQKQAETTAAAATAPGSAFDSWQKSYMGSLDDVEASLKDYQDRLFTKLRPQLITSLQSQGLLNTGALNEAFAGAAGDLAAGTSNYMATARQAAAQDIANTKYAVTSSPTNYKLGNIFNTVPNMAQAGQSSLQNVWNNIMQQNAFQQQNDMFQKQLNGQPSLLQMYGGQLLGGVAAGFGQSLGAKKF